MRDFLAYAPCAKFIIREFYLLGRPNWEPPQQKCRQHAGAYWRLGNLLTGAWREPAARAWRGSLVTTPEASRINAGEYS